MDQMEQKIKIIKSICNDHESKEAITRLENQLNKCDKAIDIMLDFIKEHCSLEDVIELEKRMYNSL